MKRLTLEDIGKLAGVSRATVSRVINNHPNIRREVRERVQQIIDEHGYYPNTAARNLASNRSHILGLVIPSTAHALFTDPYFPRLIQGIAAACNADDYTLSLFLFHSAEEERKALQRLLGTGSVDGLIISADTKDPSFLPRLQERGLPFVLVGQFRGVTGVNFVDADNEGGAYVATEHLIRLGHQRIAFIGSEKNEAAAQRYTGYQRALQDHNVAAPEQLRAFLRDFSTDGGYRAMKKLLPHQPDAVFAVSDAVGVGALHAMREAGLTVPDDIALVAFDDLPPSLTTNPKLTTVRQPVTQMGTDAVKMLLAMIDTPLHEPQTHILRTELVIRESCGAGRYHVR